MNKNMKTIKELKLEQEFIRKNEKIKDRFENASLIGDRQEIINTLKGILGLIPNLKKQIRRELVDWHCKGVPLNYTDVIEKINDINRTTIHTI